jgi:hypothetical protein
VCVVRLLRLVCCAASLMQWARFGFVLALRTEPQRYHKTSNDSLTPNRHCKNNPHSYKKLDICLWGLLMQSCASGIINGIIMPCVSYMRCLLPFIYIYIYIYIFHVTAWAYKAVLPITSMVFRLASGLANEAPCPVAHILKRQTTGLNLNL